MPTVPISVSGGRVTSKDRSLLQPGELTVAKNCEYHVNDPALHQVPGRTAFNAAAEAASIVGIAYLEHDTLTDRLLIASGTELKTATIGTTGTFASLPELQGDADTAATTTITAPVAMDVTHYNDKYYYADGVNGPYKIGEQTESPSTPVPGGDTLYSSLNLRFSQPTAPTVDTAAGASTGFVLSTGKTMSFWQVEFTASAIPGALSESTVLAVSHASEVATITGTGAIVKPVITYGAGVNTQATHIQLYMTSTDAVFPLGSELGNAIAVANGGTTTIDISGVTTTDPLVSDFSQSSQTIYPILTVVSDGVTGSFAKYGQVPLASTGDTFEDSWVVNDVNDKTLIRYSFPDDPVAFPTSNFVRFETKEQDSVTCVRTIGNSLIVGMSNSIWRVALLPRPEDATFDRGRIRSVISSKHGIVGANAAVAFGFGARSGESPELLAFVSRAGVMSTNGFAWDVLTDDVDWENTVEESLLSQCVLVNNARKFRLELYYTPTGGTTNTECMYMHYHPSHAKSTLVASDNRVKAVWPVLAKAVSAAPAVISGKREVFTGHADGVVYLEGNGNSDASASGGNAMDVTTALYQGGGIGNQSMVERLGVQHPARSGQTATTSMTVHNSGADDTVLPTDDIALDRNEVTWTALVGQGDGHQFGFSATAGQTSVAINYFVVQGTAQGESREP